MADIQIEGLTHRQRSLADVIWACQSKEQVMSFIKSLQGELKREAETVLELMMLAVWDNIDTVDPEVVQAIDNCR